MFCCPTFASPEKMSGRNFAMKKGMAVAKRFVYVLRSIPLPERYYVGLTSDLESRLATHNSGGSQHTALIRPWELVTSIAFGKAASAIAFEKYLKTGSGRAFAKPRSGNPGDCVGAELSLLRARRSIMLVVHARPPVVAITLGVFARIIPSSVRHRPLLAWVLLFGLSVKMPWQLLRGVFRRPPKRRGASARRPEPRRPVPGGDGPLGRSRSRCADGWRQPTWTRTSAAPRDASCAAGGCPAAAQATCRW